MTSFHFNLRHFIPKHLGYDHEKELSNAEHFKTYAESFKKDPVIIYVHGNDRDRSKIRLNFDFNLFLVFKF